MNIKKYPQAVALRKGLVGIATVIIILIMGLILYNLYQASNHQTSSAYQNHKVESVASAADTNWYQNKNNNQNNLSEINYHTINSEKIKSDPQLVKNNALDNINKENNLNSNQDKLEQQELFKAMSASIGSNQLIAARESPEPALQVNNQAGLEHLNQAEHDQNRQDEKSLFIENHQQDHQEYLNSVLKNPLSPYELQAGTIIPGALITGVNSDLPGQIIGQVRSNVYDSISGKYILIPQGARLTGLYDAQIAYGQERILVVWQRIIFPNGQSINLQGMPGVDLSGYSGLHDQVNNHYSKIFGSVILMSALGAGAQLSQPQNNNAFAAPSVGQTLAQSLGTNLVNLASAITNKNLNVQPTLEIRPGYEFNITVTKDMVFPGPYGGN